MVVSFGPSGADHRDEAYFGSTHVSAGAPLAAGIDNSAEIDEWGEAEDFSPLVRPYSWTRGRTVPAQDLALETLVSTSDEGRDLTTVCSAEHAAITRICAEARSVAEVAALLTLPLGVTRVLLADMLGAGLLRLHHSPLGGEGGNDFALLERVLAGLHRL